MTTAQPPDQMEGAAASQPPPAPLPLTPEPAAGDNTAQLQPQQPEQEPEPMVQPEAAPSPQLQNQDTGAALTDEQVLRPITPETLAQLVACDQEIAELKRRAVRMAELVESTMDACEKFGRDVLAADNELVVLLEREVEQRNRLLRAATARPYTAPAAPYQHH